MNSRTIFRDGCFLITLLCTGVCPSFSTNAALSDPAATKNPALGKIHNIPKLQKLPDLTITRIYSKKHRGVLGIWADIKNNGGPIPDKEFNQADIRFYVDCTAYICNNGYTLQYLKSKGSGILSKTGGSMSVVAPSNMTCRGVTQVRVEVDRPVQSGGRIRESNEHNNVKTVTLHCP